MAGNHTQKHTHFGIPVKLMTPLPRLTLLNPQLLINKGSCRNRLGTQRSGGFAVVGFLRRHVIKECCLLSCWISWETQDALLRWKQDTSACTSLCTGCFPTRHSLLSSLGPGCNGEWFRRFQWRSEHSAQPVTIPSHFFRSVSLTSSLTLSFIWHPSHLSPACRHIYNPTAVFLSIATFPVLHHPPRRTGHVRIILCQCFWM